MVNERPAKIDFRRLIAVGGQRGRGRNDKSMRSRFPQKLKLPVSMLNQLETLKKLGRAQVQAERQRLIISSGYALRAFLFNGRWEGGGGRRAWSETYFLFRSFFAAFLFFSSLCLYRLGKTLRQIDPSILRDELPASLGAQRRNRNPKIIAQRNPTV